MSIADKLVLVAENQQKVFEAGKQAEYDAFWDLFQQNGTRTGYGYAFVSWLPDFFRPKYELRPRNGVYMFREFNYYSHTTPIDFVSLLEETGAVLDFSACTSWTQMFFFAKITHLGTLDMRAYTSGYQIFNGMSNLVTIDKLILNGDVAYDFSDSFTTCRNLENLTIEGTVGAPKYDRFKLNECTKLSHDSLMSIINSLKDYTGQPQETTPNLVIGSTNIAKLTSDELAIATNKGWAVT